MFDMFPVKNGLKQGDALSPLLVNFALEYVFRRVRVSQDGLKLNGTHQLLIYADDINIMTIPSTKTKSMAMWGNHIQRVKTVINDNIIEQITDFKYLGYRISDYGSDLEDKVQTYNKINGAIRRHFGKQRNKVKNSQHYS